MAHTKEYWRKYYRERHRALNGNQTRAMYLKKVSKPFSKWQTNCSNPKERARILLQRAIRKGKIIKPDVCADCKGLFQTKEIHGHHENYKKWWKVVWICHICHVKRHPEWGEIRMLARVSKLNSKIVHCPHCQYSWIATGKMNPLRCPQCRKVVRNG